MVQSLVHTTSIEEVEYARLVQEITDREKRIGDLQSELDTLKRALARFELEYRSRVGPFLAEVERLRDELAEYRRRITWLRAGVNPDPDDEEQEAAAEFMAKREERRAEEEPRQHYRRAFHGDPTGPRLGVANEAELRRLYRELAKRFHPDLAASSEERVQREEIMLRINAAFRDHDLSALRLLEGETERYSANFAERSLTEKLDWAEREVVRLDGAIQDLQTQITVLRNSDTYQYWKTPEIMTTAIEDLIANASSKCGRLQERLAERKVVYRRLARRQRR